MLQNLGLLDFLFSLLHHVLKSDTMSADVNPRWVGVVSMRGMFFALSDGSNPVTYAYKKMMREMTLSVFVDESGIWNESDASSRYYIVSFVLHDQSVDVTEAISALDRDVASLGIVNLCFHAAPIIRGNGIFEILSEELRRKIFSRMMGFVRKVDFKYHCLCVDKRYCDTEEKMKEKLERQMHEFILGVSSVIDGFSRVKVYYDCGQTYITHLLHKGFGELKIPIVEFAQSVKPRHYKLFQVADLICTLRLLAAKLETEGRLSPSEFRFFGGIKAFKHNVLRRIKPKEI